MIATYGKIAESIEVAWNKFVDNFKGEMAAQAVGSVMVSYILQAMSMAGPADTVEVGIARLREQDVKFNILDANHRAFMTQVLKDMYEPLCVKDMIILGITPEGRVYITSLHAEGAGNTDTAEVKRILQAIVNTEDEEDLPI